MRQLPDTETAHRPPASKIALQRVEPEPWQVQMLDFGGDIETCKDPFDLADMVRHEAATITLLEKELQALMPKADDHSRA